MDLDLAGMAPHMNRMNPLPSSLQSPVLGRIFETERPWNGTAES